MKTNIVSITTETNDIPEIIQGSKLSTNLWFSGCGHNCKGCHNQELQNRQSGLSLSDIYQELKNRRQLTDWVVLTGGDPLFSKNVVDLYKIIKIAYQFNYKIFVYTGYTYKEIEFFINCYKSNRYYIDYIKCGKYIKELKNNDYIFASTNQELYDAEGNCIYYYDQEKEEIINTLNQKDR